MGSSAVAYESAAVLTVPLDLLAAFALDDRARSAQSPTSLVPAPERSPSSPIIAASELTCS